MDKIELLVFVVVLAITIYLMIKEKKNIAQGQSSDDQLTGKQKIITWVLCFLNPIIAGAVFYYGWRKQLPVKAKQANQISLWAFFILLILAIIYSVVVVNKG